MKSFDLKKIIKSKFKTPKALVNTDRFLSALGSAIKTTLLRNAEPHLASPVHPG